MRETSDGIFSVEKSDNIYIIGDIHGDYQCLIHCLVDLCKCVETTRIYNDEENNINVREHLEWKPDNNSTIIFCGDLIHRKRYLDHVLDDECSDVYIIKTLLRLKEQAKQYGGNIILIAGNHEIINILDPNESIYTSPFNLQSNYNYFSNVEYINEYIRNSYAWVKVGDTLIAHGGLCSEYLNYINRESTKENIVSYINKKYHKFFNNFDYKNVDKNSDEYNLFIYYNMNQKYKHNPFWCREWGYDNINCQNMDTLLKNVSCKKMIIAHCPQFMSQTKPKNINFECKLGENNYALARIDLGMSRSFDYNKYDNFLKYIKYNYYRKISVLNPTITNSKMVFGYNNVISMKLSCLQYLLLKYGITENDWNKSGIQTNWLGFKYIDKILSKNPDINESSNKDMINLLYPIINENIKLTSVDLFKNYKN